MEIIKKTWNLVWDKYFEFLESLTLLEKLIFSFFFSLLTGISAQIYIKLPFTPVPLTLQTFTVLLSGILLGSNFGCISQFIYFILGIIKIPWFYGLSGGFLRPTTGYIIGFIFASYLAGYFADRKRKIIGMFLAMLSIYICGISWLRFFTGKNLKELFFIGVLPFIPFDILKAFMAGYLAKIIKKEEHEKV